MSGVPSISNPRCRHGAMGAWRLVKKLLPACRRVAAPLSLLASPLAGQAPVIDSLVVVTHDVFAPDEVEVNPALGVMNALHSRTRPYVVRREVLFRAGETLDTARVRETLRNLRQMGLFRHATVDTFRANGRFVTRVQTFDGWTTSLELNGRSTGGVFTWSTGIAEQNLLGTGNALALRYRKDPDRSAYTLQGGIRRVFGTPVQATGYYDRLSDGHLTYANISSPFRSVADRRSFELAAQSGRQRILRFRDGRVSETFRRRHLRASVIGAIAPVSSPAGYLRLGLWGHIKDEEYIRAADTALVIPDSVSGTVAPYLHWQRSLYIVVTHYNGFARQEDVDLSASVLLGSWIAPTAFGYARSGIGPFVEAQLGIPLGRSFARVSARVHGLFNGAGLDSGLARGSITLALRPLPRQSTILRFDVSRRHGQAPGSEIDLGHGAGPRAFGPHAFTGTRGAWGTVEHRVYLIDELWDVVGIGVAAFFDYGGAWYGDQARRLGGDVGLGLRLGPTRATGTNVGRFDLAYRFGDGAAGGGWVFSLGRSVNY